MFSKFGFHHFIFALLPVCLLFLDNIHELAVRDIFSNYKKIRLNFYNLREKKKDDMVIQVEYDDKKLEEIKENIQNFIFDIGNEEDFLPKESLLCEWCYFWKECEVKSTNNPSIRI